MSHRNMSDPKFSFSIESYMNYNKDGGFSMQDQKTYICGTCTGYSIVWGFVRFIDRK